MAGLRKIMITPFFGELPEWKDKFLPPAGYDWLLDQDINSFRLRVQRILGFDYPGLPGTGKVWDYRCALGLLYAEEIKGYDYWGHMDFDMVFGDVNKWFTDELLGQVDVWSNHHSYVNGCFSLYSNIPRVNNLFKEVEGWEDILKDTRSTGWVEMQYSRHLEKAMLPYRYSFFQGWPYTVTPNLKLENGKLYQDGEEIAMFHFRRSKKWPL